MSFIKNEFTRLNINQAILAESSCAFITCLLKFNITSHHVYNAHVLFETAQYVFARVFLLIIKLTQMFILRMHTPAEITLFILTLIKTIQSLIK